MRKEIIICDCCQKEGDEIKRPIRHQYVFRIYGFDLCENCYDKLKEINDFEEQEVEKIRKKCESELKEKYNNIYKLIFGKSEE